MHAVALPERFPDTRVCVVSMHAIWLQLVVSHEEIVREEDKLSTPLVIRLFWIYAASPLILGCVNIPPIMLFSLPLLSI